VPAPPIRLIVAVVAVVLAVVANFVAAPAIAYALTELVIEPGNAVVAQPAERLPQAA